MPAAEALFAAPLSVTRSASRFHVLLIAAAAARASATASSSPGPTCWGGSSRSRPCGAVVLPILARRGEVDAVHGRFALGVLLVQDGQSAPATPPEIELANHSPSH